MALSRWIENKWDAIELFVRRHRRKTVTAGFFLFFLPQWLPTARDAVVWIVSFTPTISAIRPMSAPDFSFSIWNWLTAPAGVLLMLFVLWETRNVRLASLRPVSEEKRLDAIERPFFRRLTNAATEGLIGGIVAAVLLVITLSAWRHLPERRIAENWRVYLSLTPNEILSTIYPKGVTTRDAEQRIDEFEGKWLRVHLPVSDVQEDTFLTVGVQVVTFENGNLVTLRFGSGRINDVSRLRVGDLVHAACQIDFISRIALVLKRCEVIPSASVLRPPLMLMPDSQGRRFPQWTRHAARVQLPSLV